MPARVKPWLTLSVPLGNAAQAGGLLAAALLARRAGREGAEGAPSLILSRLAAYFSEHAFAHYLVGRAFGIRFTGYGLHGTSHPHLYPPGARWLFSRLPLLSARVEPSSLRAASPAARAAMYSAGTISTLLVGLAIPAYGMRRGVRGARGLFVASGGVINAFVLGSEALRPGGDLSRAWRALGRRAEW